MHEGFQALRRGELEQAEAIFASRLREDPSDISSLRGLALICIERNNTDFAEELLRTVLRRNPDFNDARCDLARVFLSRGQYHEALAILDFDADSLSIRSEVYLLRGNAFRAIGEFEESLRCYERGYKPEYHVEFLINRVNVLTDLKRFEEAKRLMASVTATSSDNDHVLFNGSLLHLRLGNWAIGWPLHERRASKKISDQGWQSGELFRNIQDAVRDGVTPRVLLYAEQGLGDVLQYLRFLNHPGFAPCFLTVQVPVALEMLVKTNFPDVLVETNLAVLDREFDFRASLLSIPAAAGFKSESDFFSEPYLRAPSSRVLEIRDNVRGSGARRCIGIQWRGGGNPKLANRSMPIDSLSDLIGPQCRIVSLRQTPSDEEIQWLDSHGVVRLDPLMTNFVDTAAVIQNLDMVVTVDTSIAHLAGAMGVPTLLLLPYSAAWVWMEGRSDSPWYPSLTVIRQPSPGDWRSCIVEAERLL